MKKLMSGQVSEESKFDKVISYIWCEKGRLIVIFVLVWLAWGVVYNFAGLNNPFKVTNPKSPNFVLRDFRITDYGTGEKLKEAYQAIFPVGTPRDVVDTVMIIGGARPYTPINTAQPLWQTNYAYKWRHTWLMPGGGYAIFVFDDNDRLLNIHPSGGRKLYPDSPGKEELRDTKDMHE